MIKFTSENPDGGYSAVVEMSSESNIDTLFDAFEAFLHAAGFDSETINSAFNRASAITSKVLTE